MVLGQTAGHVVRAHVWPNHSGGDGLELFGLQADLANDRRNFLLLHHAIEKQFDELNLIFVPCDPDPCDSASSQSAAAAAAMPQSANGATFKLIFLNPDPHLLGTVVEPRDVRNVTFADLHGRRVRFGQANNMPFTRLLAAHAMRGLNRARTANWQVDDTLRLLNIEESPQAWPLKKISREGFDLYSAFALRVEESVRSSSSVAQGPPASTGGDPNSRLCRTATHI